MAFWDEITLSSQEKKGKVIAEDHMIGNWRIVVVKDLPFSDQRLNGKIPKVLSRNSLKKKFTSHQSVWPDIGLSENLLHLHSIYEICLLNAHCLLQMLSHRLFPNASFSIWVDSKSQFRRDPIGVLEALLWRTNSVLAISEHGARSSLYDEAKAVIKKHKAMPEEVEIQLLQYRLDGIPDEKRLYGKKGLLLPLTINHIDDFNVSNCEMIGDY